MKTRRWIVPLVLIGLLALIAALAPYIAPYPPDALDLAHRRAAPSFSHWFGTDELGRDVLTRVLFGARISLAIGVLSAAIAGALGIVIGATSGWARGWIDALLMRLTDAMLAVPRLPLLMIIGAILTPPVPLLIVLVGAVGWMETARVVRAEFLSLREREFVEGARAVGATSWRVIGIHLMPNVAEPIMVSMTLAVGRGILLESALSFFGVGVQPPIASWGNMLYQAQTTMTSEPWLAVFPGAMIFATVLCINALADRA
jgi:peptide/nickel transport system permease protein